MVIWYFAYIDLFFYALIQLKKAFNYEYSDIFVCIHKKRKKSQERVDDLFKQRWFRNSNNTENNDRCHF